MSIDAIRRILAALPKPQMRSQARNAHSLSAEFHAAMAEVIEADDEIENATKNARDPILIRNGFASGYADDIVVWEKQRQEALGRAAVAMGKMPILWAELLGTMLAAQGRERVA